MHGMHTSGISGISAKRHVTKLSVTYFKMHGISQVWVIQCDLIDAMCPCDVICLGDV